MSFVKDNDNRTRGVGAIASMDAASPGRRLAAARQSQALARRDALMARSTLGRVALFTSPATGGTYGARTLEVDHFGRGAGGLKQPSGPSGGGGAKSPPSGRTPPGKRKHSPVIGKTGRTPVVSAAPSRPWSTPDDRKGVVMVKSPGSVIDSTTGAKGAGSATPAKTTTIITGGGGGWSGGGTKPSIEPVPINISQESLPELPEEGFVDPAPPTTQPKASSNVLLYAALGIGAFWLLTRK